MPRRKPVEAESAPLVSNAVELKKAARAAAAPKTKRVAAHKHHAKSSVEPDVEAPVVVQSAVTITHEAIARLAYSYWEARGHQGGSPEQDWFRAEGELLKFA
jgi:hypothetical protein